jgi:hypothetical protein
MKKREEFAVSLRKKKTQEIINAKRRRLIGVYQEENQGPEHVQGSYKGYTAFEANPQDFNKRLEELCPEVNKMGNPVSLERRTALSTNNCIDSQD